MSKGGGGESWAESRRSRRRGPGQAGEREQAGDGCPAGCAVRTPLRTTRPPGCVEGHARTVLVGTDVLGRLWDAQLAVISR